MSTHQRAKLSDWAVQEGWLEERATFDLVYLDGETEELRTLRFTDEQAAREEYEDYREISDEVVLTAGTSRCATRILEQQIGFNIDPWLAESLAITCWVERSTAFDGVWWADELAPQKLSAPRGVIVVLRIPFWTLTPCKN